VDNTALRQNFNGPWHLHGNLLPAKFSRNIPLPQTPRFDLRRIRSGPYTTAYQIDQRPYRLGYGLPLGTC